MSSDPRLPIIQSVEAYRKHVKSGRRKKMALAMLEIFMRERRLTVYEILKLRAWKEQYPGLSTTSATVTHLYQTGVLVTIARKKERNGELYSIYTLREYVNKGQKYIGYEHEHRCRCPDCGMNHRKRGANRNVPYRTMGEPDETSGDAEAPTRDPPEAGGA